MIANSFIILERISNKLESNIWKQNIHTWDDFVNAKQINVISKRRKIDYNTRLKEAKKALYSLNSSYFIDILIMVFI